MAIKFGDLIENINSDRAVIDLLQNNAKGILFVSDFTDDNADPASNTGCAGIPEEKRGIGSIVCDTSDGSLYCYTGGFLEEQITANPPEPAANGSWDDTDEGTREWVKIGEVPVRDSVLNANISPGPEPFDAEAIPTIAQLRDKINEIISNPPRSFGRFIAGDEVVGSGESMTAIDIIVRALSQFLDYDVELSMTSGSTIEFGQTIGSVALSWDVTSLNYDLTNEQGQNIQPQSAQVYYREVGGSWASTGTQINYAADDFTSPASSNTKTYTFNYTAANITSQFNFDGFEFKVEIRDNSDEGDLANVEGQTGQTNPIIGVSNTVTATVNDYVAPTGTLTVAATNDESGTNIGQPDNWSTVLRSKGNFATTVTWTVDSNSANGYGQASSLIPITAYKIQKRKMVNGTWGGFVDITVADGTADAGGDSFSGTGSFTSLSGTFNYTGGNENVNTTDAVQFKIIYTDASGATNQNVVGTIGSQIHFRHVIYGGFADIGDFPGAMTNAEFNTQVTSATVEDLSITTRGWSANDSSIPAGFNTNNYGTSSDSGASFPRLEYNVGYAEAADNTMPDYITGANLFNGTSTSAVTDRQGTYGWAYNSGTEVAGNGVGSVSTRIIFGIPDDELVFAATSAQFPAGLPSGSVTCNKTIENAFGASFNYLVSGMDTAGAMTNPDASTKTLIKFVQG